MDPNENLREQREITQRMLRRMRPSPEDAVRLAELVEALDSWITNGGFLPTAWQHGKV